MPTVIFTSQLQRFLPVPEVVVEGDTIAKALAAVFANNIQLQGYVLDERGQLRKHVEIFTDGTRIKDRISLGDALMPSSKVYVLQALSGG